MISLWPKESLGEREEEQITSSCQVQSNELRHHEEDEGSRIWIKLTCQTIKEGKARGNSKKVYQLINNLIKTDQHKSSVIKDRKRGCIKLMGWILQPTENRHHSFSKQPD